MSKIISFVKKHSTFFTFLLVLTLTLVVASVANAQGSSDAAKAEAAFAKEVANTAAAKGAGPFQKFLERAAQLFAQTRYALFTIAAFAFCAYAWTAIKDGKIEWEKIFYLIVGLVILGVAGFVVNYMAGGTKTGAVVTQQGGFEDISL